MPFVAHRYHPQGSRLMSVYFTKEHEWIRVEAYRDRRHF
jgi:hypothetical protein